MFKNDEETYSKAKKTSDSYEHSFAGLSDVLELATESREKTAFYLRSAIFEILDLEPEVADILLNHPYDKPLYWAFAKYVRGYLIGDADRLANENEEYPRLDWISIPQKIIKDPDGSLNITFNEKITPKLAQGISFEFDKFEVFGPPRDIKLK